MAALEAKGLTARQIASHLVLSTRTVETHLANARAKLGVASKSQIAHRAAAIGLEGERPT